MWAPHLELEEASPTANAGFGRALALSGESLVVGADRMVSVFSLRAESYELKHQLYGIAAGDGFGRAVAFDGDTLAVGAPDSGAAELQGGAVFVW